MQNRIETWRVSAFRQPKTPRLDAEKIDMLIPPDQDLCAHGFARLLEQGKQPVRRGAADDFESAGFLQFTKGGDQIAFPFLNKKPTAFRKQIEIKSRQLPQLLVISISFLLPPGQIEQKIDMLHVTLAQKLVLQHRAKRRRNRHRELERDGVAHQPLHHLQQRNIGFGDGFKEPGFLEKTFVLGMTNKRKMRVEDERYVTGHFALSRE